MNPALPRVLLSRVEDAALNASAPPAQWWVDGWLLRAWPGKARRARCVHAMAGGLLPLAERLAAAERVCAENGVPLIFRITPFTQPAALEGELQALGFVQVDPTAVLVRPQLHGIAPVPVPAGLQLRALDSEAFAETVGALRGSPPEHRRSHARRLLQSPVPHRALALCEAGSARVLACAQMALEPPWVGLYDVFTAPEARQHGYANLICGHLLSQSVSLGATGAYLQVDAANAPALAVYRRLGFGPAYAYHYLERPAGP